MVDGKIRMNTMSDGIGSFVDFQDPKEQILIQNIQKIVLENEAVKKSLAKHNDVIEGYCIDLEILRRNQIKEKEETKALIDKLKAENADYRLKLSANSIHMEESMEMNFIEVIRHSSSIGVLENIGKDLKMLKGVVNPEMEKSLKHPVQETQQSVLISLEQKVEKLMSSLTCEGLAPGCYHKSETESQLHQKIEQLKGDLSEHMKNTERLLIVQQQLQETQDENAALLSDKEKLKKKIVVLQDRVEQLEFEPSVEIMQISSPQQAKAIEGLNEELSKTNEKISTLNEENECLKKKLESLNEACLQMNKSHSLHGKNDDQEVDMIVQTYETKISCLKDEIANERMLREKLDKTSEQLSGSLEEHQRKQLADSEELASMMRTIEMLRKREIKDMDKLNKLTFERDHFKKECEEKILVIKSLHDQLQNVTQVSRNGENGESDVNGESGESGENGKGSDQSLQIVTQNDIGEFPDDFLMKITMLTRQLSSAEETIGILSEENTNLKAGVKTSAEKCRCIEMEKRLNELLEENETLQTSKADGEEILKRKYYEEKNKNENLEETVKDLQTDNATMQRDFKQKQENDGKIIQCLNEELKNFEQYKAASQREYRMALEDSRQNIEELEARLAKAKNDVAKLWQNCQGKVTQINTLEDRKKELDELVNSSKMKLAKMESFLKERYEENKELHQLLKNKEREIERLTDEVQTMDILKEQVKVYEADFKMEREAREKQHDDVMALRDRNHNLQLENGRLLEDLKSMQRPKMQELRRRYDPAPQNHYSFYPQSQHSGIYGRGGAPVIDNRMEYLRSDESGRGSIEVHPQESDQTMQRACPKCHVNFPDLDTLQLHVLECID